MRYIIKKRMINGRGGDPKLPEWYIVDTKDNSNYPGGAGIVLKEVERLCNLLNWIEKV